MNFDFKVKWCPVCNQGWIEIVKDKKSGELFLCCSECETEWSDPSNMTSSTGTHDKFGIIESPTLEEIQTKGWEKFIIKS